MRLTRIPGGRRRYVLEGVGTLSVTGWSSRAATAEARGLRWTITYRGIWQPVIQAADPAGDIVGTFKGRTLRRGGSFAWSDRKLALRPDTRWPARYVLVNGDRMLATIEGTSWDDRSGSITVDEQAEIDPELLLFVAFVVGKLAPNADEAQRSNTPSVERSHGRRRLSRVLSACPRPRYRSSRPSASAARPRG